MQDTILNIENWANEKGLLTPENTEKQLQKLGEEYGELIEAILKKKPIKEVQLEVGDMGVVLIILSQKLGFDFLDAVDAAYQKSKNRGGKTENGVFIKKT